MAKEFKHDSVGTQLTQNEYESTTGHVIASQAVGDIVYASTTSQLTGLAIGEQNQILTVSSAGIPEWVTSITLGDGDAEDVAVIIDGNAVDFHIGLDDSADDLVIGTGSTLGTATAISIDGGGTLATTFYGDVTLGGTTPTLTIGDAGAEDTAIVFDGNAQDFYIGLDDSADDLIIGLGNTVGTTPAISIDENRNVTFSDGSIDIDIASHDTSNGLKLGGTLVTSTAAELNILDGVTSTATELNIMDGDTSVGTSTVADGDGIVTNDGGTMKQTTVQTFATYFADEITAMSNLVTTGALNSGSITSGFGSINIGSSALTTSGTTDLGATTVDSLSVSDANITNVGDIALDSISADGNDINIAMTDNRSTALTIKESTNSYLTFITTNSSEKIQVHQALDIDAASDFGSNAMTNVNIDSGAIDGVTLGSNSAITTATIDNVIINGATIGHTDDTDLITLADGIATVAGEVSMTTLDIGGTNVTATAAELNLLDGGTSVGGSITLADSDGVVVNDGGTMKTIPASDVKTYVGAGDITGVTAGDGITGGGTSGGVTVAVDLGTNSGLEISSNKLQIAKGISEHDTAQFGAGVADGDFLKISSTSVVGRSTSEVLSDIGASAAAGSSSIVTTGALDAGSITSGFGTIDTGSSAISTTGAVRTGDINLGHASDTTIARASAGEVTIEGVAVKKVGTENMWVPAQAMTPRDNAGCGALTTTAAATNGRADITHLPFDASTQEHAQFSVAMPKSWNEGTIKAQFYWTTTGSDTDAVIWGISGVSYANDNPMDVAFGTAVTVTDNILSAAKDILVTAETADVTIAGSPAAGEICYFEVFRDADDGSDTVGEDCLLIGVKIIYTTDTSTDA